MVNALATANFDKFANFKGFPKFDMNQMLHGEEEITVFKPIKYDGTRYKFEQKFIDVLDKGKNTIMIAEKLFKEVETGEVCARIIIQCVIRGMGGFGYKGFMKSVLQDSKPQRQPDYTVEEKTLPE